MSFFGDVKKYGMMKAYDFVDKDFEANAPKLLNWLEDLAPDDYKPMVKEAKENFGNPDNNWYKLVHSFWTDIDDDVRKAVFKNFLMNGAFAWKEKREALKEKHKCNIPWTVLMDPTSACNLKCTGCWAAEYGDKLNMSFDTLDSIIEQGKELGLRVFLFSGGEPLVRKKDIIALCDKHSDCQFLAFTNGTLIDEEFAEDMLRVKNFVPAISVEGFEEATDFRRGQGTYKKVEAAMDLLREKKLPFGISCCYTSKNIEVIGSEEYFDWMVDKGGKFCWFFTFMPVGKGAPTELMVDDRQRAYMYQRIRKFRKTKPLFTIDFWNDGEYVDGCIAGGRHYLHINANGDIEPCAFIHYSDCSIYETSLLDALKSPLFMGYKNNQPFNQNYLRPCPLLDNPGELSAIVHESGAKSTDMESPEDVVDLSNKCVSCAKKWAVTADRLWAEGGGKRLDEIEDIKLKEAQ